MILKLYSEIAQFILDNLPEGQKVWIDLDRGQLRNLEAFESLVLPSVLIEIDEIDWQSETQEHQTGEVSFALKIINRLPEPLFYNDNFSANIEALQLEDIIHQAIAKNKHVQRTKTKSYPVKTVFVIQHDYKTGYDYEPTPPEKISIGDLTLKTTLQTIIP